jgi:S1-C subfamily serine protease
LAVLLVAGPSWLSAEEPTPAHARLPAIFAGGVPATLDELKAMQQHVQTLSERVLAASVGVQVGAAQGSGVIVSPEGFVLTAAHVIGSSGRIAQIHLPDGQRVVARTLGTFRTLDAGLLKLESTPGSTQRWPYIPMGESKSIALGQWCLATGHPGGIQNGRQPSVRLGRILAINPANALSSDCTLIGGDSGGPLFDMQGKVIGIHSRIGGSITANLHVPISAFHENWERLERGDNWGYIPGNRPFIGVQGVNDSAVCRLSRVFPNSPAEKAGLQVDDVVQTFGGKQVSDFASLRSYVEDQEPGAKVAIEVQRGNQRLVFEVQIGRVRE